MNKNKSELNSNELDTGDLNTGEINKYKNAINHLNIHLKLFGEFRKYIESGHLEIAIPPQMSLAEFRMLLAEQIKAQSATFQQVSLIDDSAFATEDQILENDFCFDKSCTIAILPPVCGG